MCAGAYRPQLNDKGKLVKSQERAWKMAEQLGGFRYCLQEELRALSKIYRVGYQHHSTSKGSGAGYPDCHCWAAMRADGGGGSVFIELKRMGKDPTADQVRVMGELQRAGHLVYLARPCCLFVGALDEVFATLAGTRCLYAKGHPDGPARTMQDLLGEPSTPPPAGPVPQRPARTLRREPPAPGTDPPPPFPNAVGYVVPMPAGDAASDAVRLMDIWLLEAGFTTVPFPLRLVVGDDAFLVQVRVGRSRPGGDQRVWRGGVPARPFPHAAAAPANALVVTGFPSDTMASAIERTEAS